MNSAKLQINFELHNFSSKNRKTHLIFRTLLRDNPNPDKRQQAIEHEQFVAEMVIEMVHGQLVDGEAKQRGGHANIRGKGQRENAAPSLCEQGKGEKTEQRTIGVAAHHVDGIDDARGVDGAKQHDDHDENDRHTHVRATAQALIVGTLANIHAIARGEGSQGGVGTGKRGRHHTEQEKNEHALAQCTRGSKHRHELVGRGGQRHALFLRQHHQQHAEREKQQVGRHESQSVAAHILLRIAQVAAREVFLHHVLVEARHHDHDEHAAQELFPEILSRHPVVPHEHPRMAVGGNRLHRLAHREAELARHLIYNQSQSCKHAERLQAVGPNERLDAAAPRVEPNQRHHRHDGGQERRSEYLLHDEADHVEPRRRARHLREQEEGRTRFVGLASESLSEEGVNRREVQFVIDRQQHEGHHDVAEDKTEAGLHIRHVLPQHHPGHRDKGDARN